VNAVKTSATESAPLKRTAPSRAVKTPHAGRSAGANISADRRAELIEKAARLFGARGYDKTSMRDISAAFGILHGSIYHHFGSKEELFIAVYSSGVDRFIADVEAAVAPHTDPWQRLEAACVAHLEALLRRESPAATVLADWSTNYTDSLRQALVAQRDRYEKLFSSLANAVELPEGMKRRYFRLGLLGALNGALMWFQPGGDSPATVAKHLVGLFKRKPSD
jgi:AcrR family transcriptional regulator